MEEEGDDDEKEEEKEERDTKEVRHVQCAASSHTGCGAKVD